MFRRPRFYPISSHCRTSDKESEDICFSICHCPLCWSITKCWHAYSIPTLTNWKGGYSTKECIKWSTSILPWSRVINMNRPNMEFPEFPSEKSRSKAGAWVRKGLVLSDRKRKLSIQIQIQYKRTIQVWSWLLDFLSGANWKGRSWQKISWQAAAPPPFFLPPILTHWYTWCKSALAVVVHLVHIGTPLTKATLTSTSLQNCYSDTLIQLVPTPNQRELLIDCSA